MYVAFFIYAKCYTWNCEKNNDQGQYEHRSNKTIMNMYILYMCIYIYLDKFYFHCETKSDSNFATTFSKFLRAAVRL